MKYIKLYEAYKKYYVLNEKISRRMMNLIDYFNKTIAEKIDDLPMFFQENYPHILFDWCDDNIQYFMDDNDDIENDDIITPYGVYQLIQYPIAYKAYCEFLYEISSNNKEILSTNVYNLNPYVLPLFVTFSYEGDINDSWLVHFTIKENVIDIMRDGHFNGITNIKNLAITSVNEEGWVEDGYCFAYDIDDAYYNFRESPTGSYGGCGVIFKSSGIKLYHNSDNEYQVVYIGNDVKNIIGFYQDDNKIFHTFDDKISDISFDKFKDKVIDMF